MKAKCISGCKLGCVDDKFSKPFNSYLGEDVVYNFVNSVIEESKYCSNVMKQNFNKELVMTKKKNKGFKNSTKCWICYYDYVGDNGKVRYHCHVTGKYRGSAHRYC